MDYFDKIKIGWIKGSMQPYYKKHSSLFNPGGI